MTTTAGKLTTNVPLFSDSLPSAAAAAAPKDRVRAFSHLDKMVEQGIASIGPTTN